MSASGKIVHNFKADISESMLIFVLPPTLKI